MGTMSEPTTDDDSARLILRAFDFAAAKHRTQKRKDKDQTPYLNHLVAVTHALTEVGIADLPTLIAAVLHDTIEDTDTTAGELERHFGAEVRDLVLELTDDTSLPKEERKRLQIVNAPHASPKAKLIKLADKTANLEDLLALPPVGWSTQRKREYYDWSEKVVTHLRGTNQTLEARYHRALTQGRASLPQETP